MIVGSLQRIGCTETAAITEKAIKVLGTSNLNADAIRSSMAESDVQRDAKLNQCDDEYFKNTEPIAERLFGFIKKNKVHIRFN